MEEEEEEAEEEDFKRMDQKILLLNRNDALDITVNCPSQSKEWKSHYETG